MGKVLRALTLFALSVPFLWLVSLALFARSAKGSFRIAPAQGNLLTNFDNALFGPDGADFLRAYVTSFALSGSCALLACVLAFPAARLLAQRGHRAAQNLAGAFIAARLVPVTAALQSLANPFGLGDLPRGIVTLSAVYLALFFPIATACLASADFTSLGHTKELLELDSPLTRRWRWKIGRSFLIGDFLVAGLVVFLFVWSEFYISVHLTRSGEITLARHFSTFETINGMRWGSLAASLIICMVPMVFALGVISLGLRRRVQKGIDR